MSANEKERGQRAATGVNRSNNTGWTSPGATKATWEPRRMNVMTTRIAGRDRSTIDATAANHNQEAGKRWAHRVRHGLSMTSIELGIGVDSIVGGSGGNDGGKWGR